MNNLHMLRGLQLAVGGTLLMFASLGHAQYSWIDAKGLRQFSDRPPPASIPAKNILKAPRSAAVVVVETAAAPTTTVAAVAPPPKSLADREADYRKRQTDKAEADKKTAGDAEQAASKMAACNSARQAKAQFDSGAAIRDSTVERSFLTDKQRDEKAAAANKAINEHCI